MVEPESKDREGEAGVRGGQGAERRPRTSYKKREVEEMEAAGGGGRG